jgi:hypothetical protein
MAETRDEVESHMPSTKCTEHANRPELSTEPCSRFFDFDEEISAFFVFFVRWGRRPDEMYEDIVKVLYEDRPEELKALLAEPRAGEANIKRFARFVCEMMLVRGTDNFLAYVSELLALVFTSRPETLKSAETVKLEEILQHPTMDDLVKRLAERRVERLSYQGMKDLQKDLAEKLNFEIFPSPEPFSRAVRIIEIRNLLVHNRGVVNRTFQTRTDDSSLAIGSLFELRPRSVVSDLDFLAKSVLDIDERAASKFGLARSKGPQKGAIARF